jgi:hypothetical protein
MYQRKEKISQLLQFANELKENGFTVLLPHREEESTWLKFYKDGYFGGIECDHFSSFNFATVHKPCRECGTGYGIEDRVDLTIENANKCLIKAPYWASSKDVAAIKQYKDVNDFINSTHNKWANYQIL